MFHGSIVALVTPMTEASEIDYKALERLTQWHIDQGTDGLVILGTTGESATVEPDERAQMIKQVVAQVQRKIPVIVGTGSASTRHAIHLTQEAMALGADAALLVTPYYNKPTQEGLYQHYAAVAEAVPIPQILYNVPSRTACDLLPETVLRLEAFSNIVGFKEATGDLGRLKALQELGCELSLYSGVDPNAMDFILMGGKGVVSVTANVAPAMVHAMCKAALAGDRAAAERYQSKLARLNELLFIETNPIPAKWILHKMGLISSGIRLPLTPLSGRHQSQIENLIEEVGLTP